MEPVGLDTTRPSATKVARCDSSIVTSSRHDPGERAARDDDVVERREVRLGAGRPAGRIDAGEAHPLARPVGAGDELPEDRLQLVRLRLGQEADLAEVDAQERHVHLGDRLRRPQERAVAAEDDEHVRAGAGARRAPRSRRPVPPSASTPRMRHQPAARSRSSIAASMVGL